MMGLEDMSGLQVLLGTIGLVALVTMHLLLPSSPDGEKPDLIFAATFTVFMCAAGFLLMTIPKVEPLGWIFLVIGALWVIAVAFLRLK